MEYFVLRVEIYLKISRLPSKTQPKGLLFAVGTCFMPNRTLMTNHISLHQKRNARAIGAIIRSSVIVPAHKAVTFLDKDIKRGYNVLCSLYKRISTVVMNDLSPLGCLFETNVSLFLVSKVFEFEKVSL